jgi:hypothetical protein
MLRAGQLPCQHAGSARVWIDGVHSAVTMLEGSPVRDFLDAYRAAFEAFDVPAIADLFSYPSQVTSDAGELAVTTVPTREAWIPQIERLFAAYRAVGVQAAEVLGLHVTYLTPRLAQATVHWGLVDEEGGRIYDFDASYTLADLGEGMRITAIAHNETPRLRASLERQRPT